MNISSLAAAALCCAFTQQAYSFQATPNHKLSFVPRMNSHGSSHGNQLRTFTSNSRVPSSALRMAFEDDMENKNNMNIPPEQQPTSMAYNTGSDDPTTTSTSSTTTSSSTTSTAATTGATTTATATATVPKDKILSDLERALMEARELKAKAEKERLEAERMSIQLTLSKIASLEDKLLKLDMGTSASTSGDGAEDSESENENVEFDKNLVKKSEEYKMQIQSLKKQLEASTSSSSSATTSTSIPSVSTPSTLESSTTTTSATPRNTIVENANDTFDESTIPPMPEEVYTKRSEAFKRFPLEIKTIYAKAVGANEDDDIETIVNKLYITEQREKKIKELAKDGETTISMLDIANAQAGYSTLPPQIQEMISESVGLENERNTTAIIEKLIAADKVKPTGDFGGVEFAMGDPDENEERGTEREFTKKEIKEAIDLFDNLPLAMKSMLSAGVGVDDNNSTSVIMKMIEEKKILPSKEGVEFVVFGDDKEDLVAESMEMIENDNYVRSMLPDAMRNEGNMPSPEEADAFFTEVLGGKTFNPECRPDPIPGGYIIRGENRMKTNDELVAALEEKMAKSSVAGKLNLYLIRDPTLVTEEQFENGTYELPVIMITGTNISPSTNRAVKPLVTVFGATCIAFFALAVSFATEDANQDPVWLEQMVTPMLISILATQVAHEAAHQVVAFKDKFKTGAPTIVPSFQLGLTGGITPIVSSPPNFNSLFDFAIAGPLTGLIISLGLMYAGLEQQVFMDAVSQAQLPSLPVGVLRSSSLAGSMVEWVFGEGVLLSPDPQALIRLHPLAIAGYVGLISNAMSLLPIGNTDGGRLSLALFGRSVSRVVRTGTIGIIVFCSFFGGDSVNLLLFYTIYAQLWQRECEIPCKNEIENVDNVRAGVALATGLLVALTVIPMM